MGGFFLVLISVFQGASMFLRGVSFPRLMLASVVYVLLDLRHRPLLLVTIACLAVGLGAAMSIEHLLALLGTAFIKTRTLPMILLLPLAVIGLLERAGLRMHAQKAISGIRSATAG